MPAAITDRNQELLAAILAEVVVLREDVSALRAAWEAHEPVVAAFRRGGVLAARTAARQARNGKASG
jgi:pimeloyl-ACP methyl ester carboxylesterase